MYAVATTEQNVQQQMLCVTEQQQFIASHCSLIFTSRYTKHSSKVLSAVCITLLNLYLKLIGKDVSIL